MCPVVYHKDLFLVLYFFSYILMRMQAGKCNHFRYADDICLASRHKNINEIEKQ